MLMDHDLERLLQSLRNKCKDLRSKNPSEADTKRILIDPLLETLGWDIRNYDEVRNEFKTARADNPADYGLLIGNELKLLIEAKSLQSVVVGDRRAGSQIIGYAATAGVEFCVLTNGDDWLIFNALAPLDVDKKQFRHLSISEQRWDGFEMLAKESLRGPRLQEQWELEFTGSWVLNSLNSMFREGGPRSLVRELLKHQQLKGRKPAAIANILRKLDLTLPNLSAAPPTKQAHHTDQAHSASTKTHKPSFWSFLPNGFAPTKVKSRLENAKGTSRCLRSWSKEHKDRPYQLFWYTFQKPHLRFLQEVADRTILLGLGDTGRAILLPLSSPNVPSLNFNAKRWDIKLKRQGDKLMMKVTDSPAFDVSRHITAIEA